MYCKLFFSPSLASCTEETAKFTTRKGNAIVRYLVELVTSCPNELLGVDISNEMASVFRFDGAPSRSENLAIPNPPWADSNITIVK